MKDHPEYERLARALACSGYTGELELDVIVREMAETTAEQLCEMVQLTGTGPERLRAIECMDDAADLARELLTLGLVLLNNPTASPPSGPPAEDCPAPPRSQS